MDHSFIELDHHKIHYYHQANQNKPSLVIIHGFHGTATQVESLGRYLSKHFSVYLPDLPGFGDSQPITSFTINKAAKVLNQFVDKLKLKQYYLSGVSLGGATVLEMINTGSKPKGIILLQPLCSKDFLAFHGKSKACLTAIKATLKSNSLRSLAKSTILPNRNILTFIIKLSSPKKLNHQDLEFRINNVQCCDPSTYLDSLDQIFSYQSRISKQTTPAFLLLNPDDDALDYQKTLAYCQNVFPKNTLYKIHIDNHNPRKKPTPSQIEASYPGLLLEISKYFSSK